MKLYYITLSGINENINPFSLAQLPKTGVELALQVNAEKLCYDSPWFKWIKSVCHKTFFTRPMRFALHLNGDLVTDFCDGYFNPELIHILSLNTWDNRPFINRVQLNFKVGRDCSFDPQNLIRTMKMFKRVRFILPWNEANADVLQKVRDAGMKFDCLFDVSTDEGANVSSYKAPLFDGFYQGYSGGFSPENVVKELQKIDELIPEYRLIWIEAGRNLKGDDGFLSIERSQKFVNTIYNAGFMH